MARAWIKVALSQSGQTVSSRLARRSCRKRHLDNPTLRAGCRQDSVRRLRPTRPRCPCAPSGSSPLQGRDESFYMRG